MLHGNEISMTPAGTSTVFGIGLTLLDAVALGDAWGAGCRLGFNTADGVDVVAALSGNLSRKIIESALQIGAARYVLSCGNAAALPAPGQLAPVLEQLVQASGAGFIALCLANPAAGRTVYQGHVFQGGRLVADLMADYRTEMTGRVAIVPHEVVAGGAAALRARLAALREQGCALALLDALDAADCDSIRACLAGQILSAGPARLAEPQDSEAPLPRGRIACLVAAYDRQTLFQLGAARDLMPFWEAQGDAAAWGLAQERDFIISATNRADAAEWLAEVAAGLAQNGVNNFVLAGNRVPEAILLQFQTSTLTAGGSVQGLRWWGGAEKYFLVKPEGFGPKNLFLDGFGPQIRLNEAAE
jgi:hypothetical protein